MAKSGPEIKENVEQIKNATVQLRIQKLTCETPSAKALQPGKPCGKGGKWLLGNVVHCEPHFLVALRQQQAKMALAE